MVEKDLGNKVTYMDQLDNYGRGALGHDFAGVFMRDTVPRMRSGQCCIVNTDPSSRGGQHWVALLMEGDKLYSYDSFGRDSKKLLPGVLKRVGGAKYAKIDDDAEQDKREENCGQRCIAWLIFSKKFGTTLSSMI